MKTRFVNKFTSIIVTVVILAVALAVVLGDAKPASATTVTTCSGSATVSINGGAYIYQQNEWNSSLQQCVSVDDTTGNWTLTSANFGLGTSGAPATYPSIYKGCHWGLCTSNSGLPIQVSQLSSATSSWSTTQPGSGAYDVAYDIWTNQTATTSGQPNGSEIMVWLNSRGGVQPFGSQSASGVSIAGLTWNVWTGRQSSWNIISYVMSPGTTSVSNLDLNALIQDSVKRGSTSSSWYLIDCEAGFEVWQGGQGLASSGFSFSASGGGSSNPTATKPAATNTPTFVPPTATKPAATNTPTFVPPTATKTNTPVGPTATKTNTPVGPTATKPPATATTGPTATKAATSSGSCAPGGTVNATISAPFTYDGAGTLCWKSNSLGSYINDWNMTSLTINGVNETNLYVASSSYPAKASDGYWYISYNAGAYGHFETK